ncbi:MAG TPA: hypothetical protein VK492_20330 [Chitinophagaceae bacterium]|nr:hypothetical protein [Chitinophagaceae bacterium]
MPTTTQKDVSELSLDLKNFRTVPQKKEANAIKAMISIKPDRFYGIMESIIDDGYIPTENIIVLKDGVNLIVKEGNRRIAALKLIHGIYKITDFGIPTSLVNKVANLSTAWKKENLLLPCTIFNANEADKADKVVALSHGKGEKASRDPWTSVATARHNRDAKGMSEPALDLLEKYLKNGDNLNNQQKDRWSGDYPLTVLHEALRFIHGRMGFKSIIDLTTKYPKTKQVKEIEDLLLDVGLEQLQFKNIRATDLDFALKYKVPPIPKPQTTATNTSTTGQAGGTTAAPSSGSPTPGNTSNTNTANTGTSGQKAVAINDPKHVANLLKKFSPKGNNRQKVVTLRDEIKEIKIANTPIAFCFLLRSMFEISAKAYCADHGISLTKPPKKGKDPQSKTLAELLAEITKHLTNNNKNGALVKVLHGALTEIHKATGILSVTSMNNLVHNPAFSVQPSDICILFGNIYPLLEAMN